MSTSQIATTMNSVVVDMGGTVLLLFLEQQENFVVFVAAAVFR